MASEIKHIWLYLSEDDIRTERRQCEEEGRDLSSVKGEFEHVLALDLGDLSNQQAAQTLVDKTIELPLRADYAYHEPSDLEGIRAARSSTRSSLSLPQMSDEVLLDKLHGAWTGRCVGCLLGKPVEGWRRPKMWGYLKGLGRWPLNDYFKYDIVPAEEREKYDLQNAWVGVFADRVDHMVEDDDTNYTTTGFAILKKHGRDFTPVDVANFWLDQIPVMRTCTAERIAYRNFCNLVSPPTSATVRNPYREWIGAQIRADFFGYACPGNPELAAEFAWRDASISHVKNGIYGEMWSAAMIAASFATDDIEVIIQVGLDQIPERCRLAEDVRLVMSWKAEGCDYDTAVERLHARWDENDPHHWCHTISNAMVVAIGLLWGENDFGRTICRAVQPCFDTDCNGATVGSILGIIHGRKALPDVWANHIHDTLHTGVAGYHVVKLEEMARQSLAIAQQVSAP